MVKSYFTELKRKINENTFSVGVIGLGYVGLPLSLLFAKKGITTIGFDIDTTKIDRLSRGESYISDIPDESVKVLIKKGIFKPTERFIELEKADVVIICVPTPLTKHKVPDLRFIENTSIQLKRILRRGQVVVLESTSYPGTTEEILKKILDESGLKVEEEYFIGFSPERVNPGDKTFKMEDIPKIVSGFGEKSLNLISGIYAKAFKTIVKASSIKIAESTKLLENIYRAVNISLINSMKIVLDAMNIDIYEVIELAKTKPFGFQAFYPSPGMGGHCIPIDPFYLSYKAKEFNVSAKFIELAGEFDETMPLYYFNRIIQKLNEMKKIVNGSKVLVIGVAYKPDTNDTRESPAFVLIEKLQEFKAQVFYYDPYVKQLGPTRKFKYRMNSIDIYKDDLSQFDFALLITPHSNIDYKFLVKKLKIIFDLRNAFYTNLKVKFPNVFVI